MGLYYSIHLDMDPERALERVKELPGYKLEEKSPPSVRFSAPGTTVRVSPDSTSRPELFKKTLGITCRTRIGFKWHDEAGWDTILKTALSFFGRYRCDGVLVFYDATSILMQRGGKLFLDPEYKRWSPKIRRAHVLKKLPKPYGD